MLCFLINYLLGNSFQILWVSDDLSINFSVGNVQKCLSKSIGWKGEGSSTGRHSIGQYNVQTILFLLNTFRLLQFSGSSLVFLLSLTNYTCNRLIFIFIWFLFLHKYCHIAIWTCNFSLLHSFADLTQIVLLSYSCYPFLCFLCSCVICAANRNKFLKKEIYHYSIPKICMRIDDPSFIWVWNRCYFGV